MSDEVRLWRETVPGAGSYFWPVRPTPAAGEQVEGYWMPAAQHAAREARVKELEALLDRIGEIVSEGRGEACIGLTEDVGFGLWLPDDGYANDPDSVKVPQGETVEEAIRFRIEALALRGDDAPVTPRDIDSGGAP